MSSIDVQALSSRHQAFSVDAPRLHGVAYLGRFVRSASVRRHQAFSFVSCAELRMLGSIADCAKHAASAAALSGCLLVTHGTAAGDTAAGARLAAARCVSCHSSTETIHATLPLLEGQPKAAFIAQWRAFRERKRTAPVMVSLAEELSEQDVDDLAEYYAALVPLPAPESFGSDAGRALADRLRCVDCHGPALKGTNAGTARLAGQKARYTVWSLQMMRAGARSHGTAAKPDPLLADISNADVESLAAYFASLR